MRNWGLQDFSCFGNSLAGSQSHSGAYKLQKNNNVILKSKPKNLKTCFFIAKHFRFKFFVIFELPLGFNLTYSTISFVTVLQGV